MVNGLRVLLTRIADCLVGFAQAHKRGADMGHQLYSFSRFRKSRVIQTHTNIMDQLTTCMFDLGTSEKTNCHAESWMVYVYIIFA